MAKIRRNFANLSFDDRFQLMKKVGGKVSTLAAYAAFTTKGTALQTSGNTLETKRNTRDATAQLAQTQTAEINGLDAQGIEDPDKLASSLEGENVSPDFLLGAGFEIVTGGGVSELIAPLNLEVKMGTLPRFAQGQVRQGAGREIVPRAIRHERRRPVDGVRGGHEAELHHHRADQRHEAFRARDRHRQRRRRPAEQPRGNDGAVNQG